MIRFFLACCVCVPSLLTAALAASAPDDTPAVLEVISTTPVPGLGLARDLLPYPVRSIDAAALERARGTTLPSLFNSQLPGVTVNEIQGNPYQADVNFRGFTASPLLGTPQGLSVFQDGVRLNEAFGDAVNWDLVPRAALAGVELIPGANPLFGLNTLGGALNLRTKDGLNHPGSQLELSGGSFGRRGIEFQSGQRQEAGLSPTGAAAQAADQRGLYFAGNLFKEDGWRDFSPSQVGQFFAKGSHRGAAVDLDLSLTLADTMLTGNGLVPNSMLQRRYRSIFTRPDEVANQLGMLSLQAVHWLAEGEKLSALTYLRQQRSRTLNGDAYTGFEDSATLDGAAGANGGDGLNSNTAANTRSRTTQLSSGASLQWSRQVETTQTTLGGSVDSGQTNFTQTLELGVFDSDRALTNGAGESLLNQLRGRATHLGLYATRTQMLQPGLTVTASGRLNQSHVLARDQLRAVTPNLDADYVYRKFNPAVGLSLVLTPTMTAYANAGQGSRAPSPIELGCSDPANPCSLPNAMQSDPYLKQVVTRSIEAGVRGRDSKLQWSAGLFSATNQDDILFIGTSTSAGYFTNFGRTRRSGGELALSARQGSVQWQGSYTMVRAVYASSACLLSPNSSSRGQSSTCTANGQSDEILISPGQRIPGIPEHALKLAAQWSFPQWSVLEHWAMQAELLGFSSQYARGNENNAHQDGSATDLLGKTRTFYGSGRAPGYAVMNLQLQGDLGRGWSAMLRISNLFDRRYATAAALAENPFNSSGGFQTNSDNWTRETFLAPGAPRALWLGLSHRFDAR